MQRCWFYGILVPDQRREGSKTLKKWFIEEKIPRRIRERVPVLDVGGAVAAVAGFGPDRAFMARPGEAAWKITLR